MPREKIKFALRIKPETQQLVKDLCPRDNCQSQNEFIEKAIHFYAGYISNRDSNEFLAPILVSTLDGTLKESETHICRLLPISCKDGMLHVPGQSAGFIKVNSMNDSI